LLQGHHHAPHQHSWRARHEKCKGLHLYTCSRRGGAAGQSAGTLSRCVFLHHVVDANTVDFREIAQVLNSAVMRPEMATRSELTAHPGSPSFGTYVRSPTVPRYARMIVIIHRSRREISQFTVSAAAEMLEL
jgi:hypothetical protein